MSVDDNYKYYVLDLGKILVDKMIELSEESKDHRDDFTNGQIMALYDVLDIMKQQAESFDILKFDTSDLSSINS